MVRFRFLLLLLGWLGGARGAAAQAVHRRTLAATSSGQVLAARHRTFYQLAPVGQPPRGLLVLLPGRGEPARNVFRATRLAQEAAARGFMVLVPELNDRIYLDSTSIEVLDAVIRQAVQATPALAARIVVGGFSAGGQLAVAYAEMVHRDSTQQPWQIRAVLGVDPPLDLAEHWHRAQQHLAAQDCPALQAGDERIVRELTHAFGGSPTQVPAVYRARSAFAAPDSLGGNAQYLRHLPVRLYCEPDLLFWQQQYCAALQLTDLNATSAAAFIACLQRQGNRRAQYLQTTGKGFQGKHRMPHSWSIVEAAECAAWLQKCLE
ncbi:MAG: alpha/beta hydrolase fold domain-containing protein [Janthinobacterium lividum]